MGDEADSWELNYWLTGSGSLKVLSATGHALLNGASPFTAVKPKIANAKGGTTQVTFYGVVGNSYVIQRNLVDISAAQYWADLITNTAITNVMLLLFGLIVCLLYGELTPLI